MTNKDSTKAVITTIATFAICATAPWIVVFPVAAGAGLYIGKLFSNDENKKGGGKKDDDKEE